jgi:AcrR family transcriptional regulator
VSGEARPRRADAARNRERVLAAAEAVLARDGLSASMRGVAAEAGVGLGTIYRNFPTQEALYQAVRADLRMPEVLAVLTAACLAAEHSQWDAELRAKTLAIVFDGMRPR